MACVMFEGNQELPLSPLQLVTAILTEIFNLLEIIDNDIYTLPFTVFTKLEKKMHVYTI